jgi:hypothetical protein
LQNLCARSTRARAYGDWRDGVYEYFERSSVRRS